MIVFRNLCYFTILFTIASAIIRILYHFLMREFWKSSGKDISFAEYMYRFTSSSVWKRRMKKPKYFETKLYTVRVITFNAVYILLALCFWFVVICISESEYGVWLDILI